MKKMPLVAIVGRPNVGKSTFFNKICGKRISIVQDTPGVTRDRIYADAEWCGYNFTVVDTGGIELKSQDQMHKHIVKQAQIAIELADVILFFVDGKEGLVSSDHDAAEILRITKKPVILVVNKLDNFELEKTYEFYELGMGEPYAVSAEQGKGLGDLLDVVVANFERMEDEEETEALKIAVVGKPNAGKSSLVNKLLGFERVIVSDVAGTTRDAIDTPMQYKGKDYILIDTAGIRRKRAIDDETVESYSVMRALGAIRRADVVLVLIDANEDISEQDTKITGYVHEQGKPSIVIMNKWDLVEKDTYTIQKYQEKLRADLSYMNYFVDLFISAKTGQRVERIFELVEQVYANASKRIPTGILNDHISDAIARNEPPSSAGKRLKIFYATQAEVCPPTFILFCNDEHLMHFSYLRYLENSLRKAIDFAGTPIKFILKSKSEK